MKASDATFFVTGGTLRQDARCYVERSADRELFDRLTQGEFCYLLTSRQMGKSSLMVRTATRLRGQGMTVAVIDLTAIGQNLTSEQWYNGMLGRIARQVDREDEMEEFWLAHPQLGPLHRWQEALHRILRELPEAQPASQARTANLSETRIARLPKQPRLVIFVDEIDTVRSLPFPADEFFAAIRECYNRRAAEPEFNRLAFCLLGVATPQDLVRDAYTTPFNVGRRIELHDFTEAEATGLAHGFGAEEKVAQAILKRVHYWTGGHPYLTQVLCKAAAGESQLAGPSGVDRLCESLFLAPRARERDDNLVFVREWLMRRPTDRQELLAVYARVLEGEAVPDDPGNPVWSVLRLSGIVRVEDGWLRVRNRIYHRVFDRRWLATVEPGLFQKKSHATQVNRWTRLALVGGLLLVLVAVVVSLGRAMYQSLLARGLLPGGGATTVDTGRFPRPPPLVDRLLVDLTGATRATSGDSAFAESVREAWRALPRGPQVLGGVKFNVAAGVALTGESNPPPSALTAVRGLPVGRHVLNFRVLHTARGAASNGVQIASLVVHYTNRYTLEFPVLYGQDVLDCQSVPAATPGGQGPTVAWRGPANPPLPQAAELALFESVWRNPLPFQVESVDYVSSQAGSAPLLMGLTLECIPRAP